MLELAAHPNIAGREAGGRRARRRHARAPRRRAAATSRCSAARTRSCSRLVLMGGAGTICAVGARLHRAVRRDDRVRARGQGRRRPRPRRGAAARRAGAASPSRTRRCSRACCTPRAASRRPTCACRWSTRRDAVDRRVAAVDDAPDSARRGLTLSLVTRSHRATASTDLEPRCVISERSPWLRIGARARSLRVHRSTMRPEPP